jgi:hypothetical protein
MRIEAGRAALNHPPSATQGVSAMASKRELIDTGTDKRYVRRNKKGQFSESVDVGRSLAADRRKKAKSTAKPGQGDKGDRRAPSR